MEFVIEGETCARIMLIVERMEKSAVLMDARKTVLNLVSLYLDATDFTVQKLLHKKR